MIPDELSSLFARKREMILAKSAEISTALHELATSFQGLPAAAAADQPRGLARRAG
jgi:hypothetical protein